MSSGDASIGSRRATLDCCSTRCYPGTPPCSSTARSLERCRALVPPAQSQNAVAGAKARSGNTAAHDKSIPSSATPAGIRPSARSFSSRDISANVFAFLIRCSTRFFSLSVNCTRLSLPPLTAGAVVAAVLALDERIYPVYKHPALVNASLSCEFRVQRTCVASSLISSLVPNSSVARSLSASLTL